MPRDYVSERISERINVSAQGKKRTHRIFLLTVWQEDDGNWRFSLEDPRTGKRKGFADIGALADGIPVLIGQDIPADPSSGSALESAPDC